jgi:hypothetical protein
VFFSHNKSVSVSVSAAAIQQCFYSQLNRERTKKGMLIASGSGLVYTYFQYKRVYVLFLDLGLLRSCMRVAESQPHFIMGSDDIAPDIIL